MKRFFITTGLITLTGSLLLHYNSRYAFTVILYHLLIMLLLNGLVFGANVLFGLIKKQSLRNSLTHTFNFIFLFSLVLFYILIIGSNAFWGKAITWGIFTNYLSSLDVFISVLPVQKWIFYTGLLLLVAAVIVLFGFVRPRPGRTAGKYSNMLRNKEHLKKIGIAFGILILVFVVGYQQVRGLKRKMHFVGEPVLQFSLGPMWSSETMEYVYDKVRMENALKDKPCIDAITTANRGDSSKTVVVILLDGLRKDYLSSYGYSRQSTPFIDSMSRANQLYHVNNFFATSTTTLLGVGSLLCSKDWDHFSYSGLNVMKYLKKKGFSTYAFLTGYHQSWYGLTAIYKNDCDHFYESTTNPNQQNFDDLRTLAEFRKTSLDKNSFVYIHLLSTHIIGKKNEQFRQYLPDKMGIGSDKKTVLVNNYDNGIVQADYVIRGVFDELREQGLLENASVYIVADHGELFGEDGRWSHSGSVQEHVLQIPLFIYDKNRSWYRNLEAGTALDLSPTIVDRLGYPVPTCWQGRSLHQPVSDFSIRINSGTECEFPEGILTRKDSLFRLEILNENKKLEKVVTSTGNGANWKTEFQNK